MRDLLEPIVVIGGLIVMIVGGIFALIVVTDYLDCRGFKNGTGIETRWEWGCYAKVDGQWIPKSYAFGKVNEIRLKDQR